MKHTVTITVQGQGFSLPADLKLDRLDPNAIPAEIRGTLRYVDGSVEEYSVHVHDPNKRMWFLGNRFEYRFNMEAPDSPDFIATQRVRPGR